jgi:wyosine [tRNA(Phe)-imidazoG37] synthetase (radical SAM superfamily)
VKDICLSGNGEPTLSPWLDDALYICASARKRHHEIAGDAGIVLITNSTGFLDPAISQVLRDFQAKENLEVWAKLDAGTQTRFARMSRSSYLLDELQTGIGEFARKTPIAIQTMLCALDGEKPDADEAFAYAARINALLENGAMLREIQFYTVARVPAEPSVSALSDDAIVDYMRLVSSILLAPIPLAGYGEAGGKPLLVE